MLRLGIYFFMNGSASHCMMALLVLDVQKHGYSPLGFLFNYLLHVVLDHLVLMFLLHINHRLRH